MSITQKVANIVESITINAPASRVFAALTQSDELLQWWTGACTLTSYHADLKAGGSWVMRGADSDGDPFEINGEFTLIQAPHLIEFTWRTLGQTEANVPFTLVRYALEERLGVTTLTVTHTGFVRELDRQNHAEGWKSVLQLLNKYAQTQTA